MAYIRLYPTDKAFTENLQAFRDQDIKTNRHDRDFMTLIDGKRGIESHGARVMPSGDFIELYCVGRFELSRVDWVEVEL